MDIERVDLGASVRLILRHRRLRQRGIQVLKAAVREFFLPQFASLLRPGIRPVAIMSHPLDDSLPFNPRLFGRYLGYFSVWLKTLACLYQMYGKSALDDIEGMMQDVVLLYNASGGVYRHCQSTTPSRRAAPGNPYFLLIALFDPHLHCIPSLHVLTICYNYYRTRKIVMRLDTNGSSGRLLAAVTYRAALRITEAVLLVKQHSLLDIGPSLFLLSRLFPDFGEAEIRRFVSDLFADIPLLDPGAAARLRRVILDGYGELLARQQGRGGSPPTVTVLEYLREKSRNPQNPEEADSSKLPRRPAGS
jgi:hypothetical protein